MRALGVASAIWVAALVVVAGQSRSAYTGTLDQHAAIDYRGGSLDDVVTLLARDLKAAATSLAFDPPHGYLRSVLERLNVPVESQLLVFSKTGIQNAHTSPETPRAPYFNDRVIVGYIPGAPFLEIASHDPRRGVIFQTLRQDSWLPGEFARPDRCLSCHLSANSLDVPGVLVRSMFAAGDGRAMPQLGRFLIDHRSPLEQRWACSYMIYSPAFDALPAEARSEVFARMRERITDRDTITILDETKAAWR